MANTAAMKYSLLRIPKAPKVEQYDLGDVQGSLQVIVHKEVASLWSEARTGATAAPEKSAIQSFEFWTELCIALLRRGGGEWHEKAQ